MQFNNFKDNYRISKVALDRKVYQIIMFANSISSMKTGDLYNIYLQQKLVSTDTRTIKEGSLYFALRGPNFNGNTMAAEALQKGASYVIIDEAAYNKGNKYILVEDVLTSLQQLARYHRDRLKIPVIGIAGSNGKTTSKELIAAVLKKKFNTYATRGNLNNHIGTPLTLLELTPQHEIAVIEMGANKEGDNAELCNIANPDHGIITNIGKDHLEGFGSVEGVARASSELYLHLLKNNGLAFVNARDPLLLRMAARLSRKVTYAWETGEKVEADCRGKLLEARPFIRFRMEGLQQDTESTGSHLWGEYNLDNIMAAVCIGRHFGVDAAHIKEAIEAYIPANNRSQIIKTETNTVFLDAYNANPSSMELALDNFSRMDLPNRVVIIGDMYELGDYSEKEHAHIVDLCKKYSFKQLILVGPSFAKNKDRIDCESFDDAAVLKDWLKKNPIRNSSVFLKASRGIKLENIVESL
jgi:UDP-N-acetylmuramoyl-tripeptide--D-alanyl-D-alanine ligase